MTVGKMKLSASRKIGEFTADGDSPQYKTNDRYGARVTFDGVTGAGSGTVAVQGSTNGTVWYNLQTGVAVASDARTVWVGEPNTYLRAQASGVAGQIDVYVQESS